MSMSPKHGYVQPGDCIFADHYIYLVPGCLPHTFGQEKQGYTCGSLFVDHASGIFLTFASTQQLQTKQSRVCSIRNQWQNKRISR
jgi:hypothetical protein